MNKFVKTCAVSVMMLANTPRTQKEYGLTCVAQTICLQPSDVTSAPSKFLTTSSVACPGSVADAQILYPILKLLVSEINCKPNTTTYITPGAKDSDLYTADFSDMAKSFICSVL